MAPDRRSRPPPRQEVPRVGGPSGAPSLVAVPPTSASRAPVLLATVMQTCYARQQNVKGRAIVAAINKTLQDANKALKDAAYVAVGFGVLSFQKAQVRRQELAKQVKAQRAQV